MKKIKYFISLLLIILTTTVIILTISNYFFLKSKKDYIKYLKNNKIDITNLENIKINNADFFLLGEIHGVKEVQNIDESLFIYVNKNYNVNYYVAEISPKLAEQINKYISNENYEDTILLKNTVKELSYTIPQQASLEYYKKWRNIRNYNSSLKLDRKIKVIGIESSKSNTIKGKDSIMYQNFITAYNRIPDKENAKFYGLFGHAHILQSKLTGNIKPFAYRLKETKLKLISISSYAIKSYTYLPDNNAYPKVPNEKSNWFNLNGPIFYVFGINDLIESSDTDKVLFSLNNEKSPYLQDTRLINIRNFIGKSIHPLPSTNTLDFIQYAILIRKSDALSSLK